MLNYASVILITIYVTRCAIEVAWMMLLIAVRLVVLLVQGSGLVVRWLQRRAQGQG